MPNHHCPVLEDNNALRSQLREAYADLNKARQERDHWRKVAEEESWPYEWVVATQLKGELEELKAELKQYQEHSHDDTPLREQLSALEHERWSHWMKYLFKECAFVTVTGGRVIPKWAVDRWSRQMSTPYHELTEKEKDRDRKEADKTLATIARAVLGEA